ncbi:hypothetical protein AVEN_270335-1 [Araneus ventricosus]|uniref:Uncharacterized protein n=1 Tax=Araneus ventricosus TaxID=182803 RepID=A0A4Y2RJN6_ARAVE|nr:hypothetical protein AVEN_270335-1 [Araneus ventricosus]
MPLSSLQNFSAIEKLRRPMSIKNLQEMIERFESTGILAVQSGKAAKISCFFRDLKQVLISINCSVPHFSQFPTFHPIAATAPSKGRSTMHGHVDCDVEIKRPFSGVLLKFGGGGYLRCRPRHSTMIQNKEVRPKLAPQKLLQNGMLATKLKLT